MERIRSVEEAGKMMEWDWGSEQLAVAESCLPSRVYVFFLALPLRAV